MSKQEKYENLKVALDDFLVSYSPKLHQTALMATLSSLVKSTFPSLIFVGFYVTREVKGQKILEIGPYQGNVLACARIEFGDGVCGNAALKKEVQLVPNVLEYERYIACDDLTKSEIVLPIIKNGEVVGVFDLDHGEFGYFDQVDQTYLSELLSYLD